MFRLRPVLPVVAVLVAMLPAPVRAEDPTVLVAAERNGGLVRVTLTGRVATVAELVPPARDTHLMPTQASGRTVSYVRAQEHGRSTRYDVGVVDATTGARGPLSRDGRSGFLLVSPDGRSRYVLRTDGEGYLVGLVRTDAHGRNARTLIAPGSGRTRPEYSGMGISGDGRTLFLARTTEAAGSTLLAVDTATGRQRAIRPGIAMPWVYNVVATRDGATLAVSFLDAAREFRVALVTVATGAARELTTYGPQTASAFTADGTGLVLSAPFLDETLPVGVAGLAPGLTLADVRTGVNQPIVGTDTLYQAVPVA